MKLKFNMAQACADLVDKIMNGKSKEEKEKFVKVLTTPLVPPKFSTLQRNLNCDTRALLDYARYQKLPDIEHWSIPKCVRYRCKHILIDERGAMRDEYKCVVCGNGFTEADNREVINRALRSGRIIRVALLTAPKKRLDTTAMTTMLEIAGAIFGERLTK